MKKAKKVPIRYDLAGGWRFILADKILRPEDERKRWGIVISLS